MRSALKAAGVLAGIGLVAALGLLVFSRVQPLQFADARREVRLALGLPKIWSTDFHDAPGAVQPVQCPAGEVIVIMTGGQSNAGNALSDPLVPAPDSQSYMMHNGSCYPLQDPVLGATGEGGSLWSGLGPALAARRGQPVVFINGAVGGSQVADWLDQRSGYFDRLVRQVAAAKRSGLVVDQVIWVQGETDAAVRLDPATYVAQMQALVAAFDASGALPADVPWLVFRSTRCKDRPNNGPALDAAITDWAASDPRVTAGPLASALGNDARRDGCHFNARGRDILVEQALPLL
jgi:hypothetical protein